MDIPLWGRLTVALALAAALAYAMTPVAILAARRFAFYDIPAGYKGHPAPTPYLGGVAVMAAFAVALLLGAGDPAHTLPLLGGLAVMLTLGTIDDRLTVSPQMRVAVEFALGAGLSLLGRGWHLGAGSEVDVVVNGVWVVGVVNAFNLFDNMDGAASTMAIVAAAGSGALALFDHNPWAAIGSAAVCGACLGFLPHNLSKPARIFLGDGGSMPLGFTVAVLTASAADNAEPSVLALLTGLLLVGIPALDTTLVIVSRRRRGVSILTGGQDHLTHRTRQRMRTARRVALVLGSIQALVSALVIVATRNGSVTVVYLLLAFVVGAAALIVGLEERVAPAPSALERGTPSTTVPSPRTPWISRSALVSLATLGLGAGLSALFSAYYDSSVWLPLGLGLVVAAAAAAVARPPRINLPVALAMAGLAGLGLFSLLSASWAQAAEQATVDANRWLAYAALLILLLVLVRGRRHATVLLLTVGLGIAAVAASVLVRMLGSDPATLFVSGRLNSPLGYINGEACVFAMGCWLSLALAERRNPVAAGVGVACTVAMASLALLSQSRGAAIASFAALIVAIVVIPGLRRRVLALATIAGGVAAAAGPVLKVYSTGQAGVVPPSVSHSAAIAILSASGLTGVAWGILAAVEWSVARRGGRTAVLLRRMATVLTVLLVGAPLVAAAVRVSAIERTARGQWHAFVHLSESGSSSPAAHQTRLLSGGGNRYDYWRIAWHAFTAHPLAGVGAGNYSAYYFRQRRTQEAIQNPHSIELQALSELGIIGATLMALLIAGVGIGAWRLRALARRSSGARTAMVAATGITVVWLIDTSGDWMHLLPGVTAIAIAAGAVLCRGEVFDTVPVAEPRQRLHSVPSLAAAATVAFVLVVAGASLLRSELAQRYLDAARTELAARPAAAIRDAARSLRLDPANLDAYYVEAAGQARFDQAATARTTLLAAVRQDPGNFVTWTLLGDLEVRLRDFRAAKVFYRRAHALDPNDRALSQLARDPSTALGRGSPR